MTGRQKASLVAFGIVILACVLGYVPWDSIPVGSQTMFEYVNIIQTKIGGTFLGNFVGTDNFTPFGWWYFNEFSVTWLIGAIIIGIINRMDLHTWVGTFIEGCKDLMGVVMVLAASRGIAIFMGSRESGMSITFIHWIQSFLSGVPLWAFVIAGVLVYICIALFLQSTSGVSGITMADLRRPGLRAVRGLRGRLRRRPGSPDVHLYLRYQLRMQLVSRSDQHGHHRDGRRSVQYLREAAAEDLAASDHYCHDSHLRRSVHRTGIAGAGFLPLPRAAKR